MAIISNDVIKGVLIQYLKSVTEVTDYLDYYGSSVAEIREAQWKSTNFIYPNIRLRVIRNNPDSTGCNDSVVTVSWLVFTEDQSSATCDELSGIIASYFQSNQFSVTFTGTDGSAYDYSVSIGRANLIPAFSVGELSWRSEVILEGYISKTT